MNHSLWIVLGAVTTAIGCGGTVVIGSGGSGSTSANNGTSSTPSSTSSGVMGPCPQAVPTQGSACSPVGQLCSYGTDARPTCRDTSQCASGQWSNTHPTCPSLPGSDVCGTESPGSGQICSDQGAVCPYPDGTQCGCSSCEGLCGPPPPHWQCDAPPAGCPIALPNAGTTCSKEGQQCTYGQPCGVSGMLATCTSGQWIWLLDQPCPD